MDRAQDDVQRETEQAQAVMRNAEFHVRDVALVILTVLAVLYTLYFAADIILPFVLWFSLSQQIVGTSGIQVQMLPQVSAYLTLVTTLLLAFGLCFQLPVVLSLAGMAGLVSAEMLAKGRRYALLGIVVVAAFVTPPDPLSQLMLSVPIYGLYEISIWCVRLIQIRRKKADDLEAAAVA